jgi:hypothetical protein
LRSSATREIPREIRETLKVDTAGRPEGIRGGSLRLPPTTPAVCPGDNSAVGLMMRPEPEGCVPARFGMGGVVVGD